MKVVFLAALFILTLNLSAQMNPMPPSPTMNATGEGNDVKPDEPPHGGSIVESGKRNIEIVFDAFGGEEKINVWLLTQKNKIKSIANCSAKLTLRYTNGNVIENSMILKDDKFYSDIKDIENAFNAIVVIIIKNKPHTATFSYKGINK